MRKAGRPKAELVLNPQEHSQLSGLAASRALPHRARYHIHYTPTYASWLNQVERWFALITQQAIHRGSFRSVRELVQKIDDYVCHHNTHKRPFVWTATADSILEKLKKLCKLINGTRH
jgi:putative transposase